MELLARLQVHMVSFSILAIIYMQLRKEGQVYLLQDRLFKLLVLVTMVPLSLETMTRVFNGAPGRVGYILHMGSNTLLFMTNISQLVIWTLYILITVNRDKKYLIKAFIPMGTIMIINMLLALSTPISGLYFYIDASNNYHRGEWYIISIGLAAALFFYNLYIIAVNWQRINQRNRLPMLGFLLPPTIGILLQSMFYGLDLIWAGGTISILMVYITIQSQVANTDYLTGLYNRRYLDSYLERKIKGLPASKKFAGIMIDMDDFKKINDQYGHTAGDEALKIVTILIKSIFHKDEVVARYGGDEFIIILDIKNERQLHKQVADLRHCVEKFNQKKSEPFDLKISVGYSLYTREYTEASSFIHSLDQLMYENKKKRKTKYLREL